MFDFLKHLKRGADLRATITAEFGRLGLWGCEKPRDAAGLQSVYAARLRPVFRRFWPRPMLFASSERAFA
jgi:hypothetical protein